MCYDALFGDVLQFESGEFVFCFFLFALSYCLEHSSAIRGSP